MDNPGLVVTDSKEKMVKKKNKRVAKKKEWLAKLHTFIGSLLSPYLEFSPFLLPCFVPASIPVLVSILIPTLMSALISASILALVSALISRSRSFAVLPSCCLPTLAASAALSLPCHALVSSCGISALLLLLSMLSPPLLLLAFRILKQSLSDKP